MRKAFKILKNWVTRRRWLYAALFRLRVRIYSICETFSKLASKLAGREILLGIHFIAADKPKSGFKYGLTACLRFKNEARYLAEWLDFHQVAGFEHFYLYNNNSTDNFREALEPYLAQGLVTLHDWPAVPASPSAELHCLKHYRNEAQWIAFIDADEFLFSVDEPDLKSALAPFEPYPAVAVNWFYYGSNGHRQRPEGLVVENYLRRGPSANRHVKSIINPRKAIRYGNSHHWYYRNGQLAVNERMESVTGSFNEPPSARRLRINHYHSKSTEDYLAKARMKSWVDIAGRRTNTRSEAELHNAVTENNDVEDTAALNFIRFRSEFMNTMAVQ
jgi:hypothetical protein